MLQKDSLKTRMSNKVASWNAILKIQPDKIILVFIKHALVLCRPDRRHTKYLIKWVVLFYKI